MLLLFPILDHPETAVSSDQWHKCITCYKCTWKDFHLRTKLTFSLHSVANISKNMLAIIHSVSHWVPLGVTRCIHAFDCLFFVVFQMYWSDNVFCTWGWILTLTYFRCFRFFMCCWSFSRGLMHYVKGFRCVSSLFRLYSTSPRTLFDKLGTLFCVDLELSNKFLQIILQKNSSAYFFSVWQK